MAETQESLTRHFLPYVRLIGGGLTGTTASTCTDEMSTLLKRIADGQQTVGEARAPPPAVSTLAGFHKGPPPDRPCVASCSPPRHHTGENIVPLNVNPVIRCARCIMSDRMAVCAGVGGVEEGTKGRGRFEVEGHPYELKLTTFLPPPYFHLCLCR